MRPENYHHSHYNRERFPSEIIEEYISIILMISLIASAAWYLVPPDINTYFREVRSLLGQKPNKVYLPNITFNHIPPINDPKPE